MPQIVGKEVGPIAYGLMNFTWRDTPATPEEYTEPLKTAIAQGATYWNAGELYGTPEHNSLHMLRDYFRANPEDAEKVVLNIKGGLIPGMLKPDSSKANVTRSVDECLRVLDGTKTLDVFECGRVDSVTPIEEVVETLAGYVKAGKLKGIALSHVPAETIHRAAKVHRIESVEVMVHMANRDILKNGVAAACKEHNIPILAYSPFGRGVLTGRIKTMADIPKGEPLEWMLNEEKLAKCVPYADKVAALAAKHGMTSAQLSLNWLRTLGSQDDMPTIIPLPGSVNTKRVIENSTVFPLFTAEVMAEINELLDEMEREEVGEILGFRNLNTAGH
ncbi:Pyridoxine 4-dehydrogenase [Ascosphaera acerosa]|nr:Pyridoxine 4-dehydrogenase [Ascosphaera acerosa]